MADSEKEFLVIDADGTRHLKVRNSPDGPLDHGLMGGAHAALVSPAGFRGNRYEGPDREAAIAKLKKLYEEENMPWPEVRASEKTPDVLLDVMPAVDGSGLVEIPIVVTGKWRRGASEFEITGNDLAAMVKNFRRRKNGEVNVDYDHASEMPDVARGGPVPSAGRILKMRSNGALYAGIEFTARALELVKNREYRFVSPAIAWNVPDKQTGEDQGATLTSLALTNRPFLEELPPIRLSEITGETRNLKTEISEGGTMDPITGKKTEDGKLEIFRGAESLGRVDLPTPPKPEEITAFFAEKIGAKGKTEDEIKSLCEAGTAALAVEARTASRTALMAEAVDKTSGVLLTEKVKELARASRLTLEDYVAAQEIDTQLEAACKAGKVLPKDRALFFEICADNPKFTAWLAEAPAVIDLKTRGLPGGGREPSSAERPENLSAGKEVVNADRVARIHTLQDESAKAGKKLGYLEARAIVLSEEAAAGIDGDGQAQ